MVLFERLLCFDTNRACADRTYRAQAIPPNRQVSITSMGTAKTEKKLLYVPQYPKTNVPTFSKTKSNTIRKTPIYKATSRFFLVAFRYSNRNNRNETDGMIHQSKGIAEGTKKIPKPKKKIMNSNAKS